MVCDNRTKRDSVADNRVTRKEFQGTNLSGVLCPKRRSIKQSPPPTTNPTTSETPSPNQLKTSEKIILPETAKKMVWGELAKVKTVRAMASKAHSLAADISQALASDAITKPFEVKKPLPQLPGGKPSWAFQTEWEGILVECSQKLMQATANHLATERVRMLGQKAEDMASSSRTELQKALPVDALEKGLQLFNIVDPVHETGASS